MILKKLVNILEPNFVHTDERGNLTQLVRDGYKQVNVILCKKGTFRGGHYHRLNTEAFYVISGKFKLTLEYSGSVEEYIFKENDFFSIPENVKHSFDYHEDTILVSMYDRGVELDNGEKDIISC